MTDLHGLPLWLRVIVALKSYFGSNERVFKRFTLFVGDYWRFFKDYFQQKLILYNAPLFYQYLLQQQQQHLLFKHGGF